MTFVDLIYPNIKPIYKISETGVVMNKKTGGFIMAHAKKNGYLQITLQSSTGNPKTLLLHRLVALHFVSNDDPEHKVQVNHIDFNKRNCSYLNLEWVTPEENLQHALLHGMQSFKGESNPSAKRCESTVVLICELLQRHYPINEIIEVTCLPDTKLSRSFISKVKSGNVWRCVSERYDIPQERLWDVQVFSKYSLQVRQLISEGCDNNDIYNTIDWDKYTPNTTRKSRKRFIQEYRKKIISFL